MTTIRMTTIRREALGVWLGSIVLSAIFGLLGMVVPWIGDNLLTLVAATFLYLPAAALWRQNIDLTTYGLTTRPLGRGLLLFVLVTLIVIPPFSLGHRVVQSVLFDREPEVSTDRLSRFDRELEGRPTFDAETRAGSDLRVWTEGRRLMMYWPAEGPVQVTTQVTLRDAAADPIRELLGFAIADDGSVVGASRGRMTIVDGNALEWRRKGPGGIGFSLAGIDAITITLDGASGAQTIRVGRFGVPRSAPIQTDRNPWWWLIMFGTQLLMVAIPEEWFYRGYLQARLSETFQKSWRVLGANLGPAWIISSVLFALGHLVLDARPERLAVFFPSLLFGWMRARTGSILAPALFHALANVVAQAHNYIYLG